MGFVNEHPYQLSISSHSHYLRPKRRCLVKLFGTKMCVVDQAIAPIPIYTHLLQYILVGLFEAIPRKECAHTSMVIIMNAPFSFQF